MEKIIDLAKKLKALSDRGVDGEKTNADKMLQDLMKKHNISIDDIEGEKTDYEEFKNIQPHQRVIHKQVIGMIMGADTKLYGHKKRKNLIIIECTKSQFIQIQAAFDFYWKAYEKELKTFTRAFVYKNNLVPPTAKEIDMSELSYQELKELTKVLGIMKNIEKSTLQKQLSE